MEGMGPQRRREGNGRAHRLPIPGPISIRASNYDESEHDDHGIKHADGFRRFTGKFRDAASENQSSQELGGTFPQTRPPPFRRPRRHILEGTGFQDFKLPSSLFSPRRKGPGPCSTSPASRPNPGPRRSHRRRRGVPFGLRDAPETLETRRRWRPSAHPSRVHAEDDRRPHREPRGEGFSIESGGATMRPRSMISFVAEARTFGQEMGRTEDGLSFSRLKGTRISRSRKYRIQPGGSRRPAGSSMMMQVRVRCRRDWRQGESLFIRGCTS